MVVLFLHGRESKPGGTKPRYLTAQGFEVHNPALPDDDFDAAVRVAQAAFDRCAPDVVVGSSRGGAVAMNIDAKSTPLVLLCPAWKAWGTVDRVKPKTIILHAPLDPIVPFAHSQELISRSEGSSPVLLTAGSDHRLSTPAALEAMLIAVRAAAARNRWIDSTPADLQTLVLIAEELQRTDLTSEQRAELLEARGDIGNAYAFDWLDD